MAGAITPAVAGNKISVSGTVGQLATYVTNLSHGEWGYAVSVPNANGTATILNSGSSPAPSRSSSNILSFVGTTVSGFVAGASGVYQVTLNAQLPTLATGRSFASIMSGNNVTEYRGSTSADDEMNVTAEFYMAAGDSVTFLFYQTTGATRTITGRFIVHYKGTL